jgi:hypothetical protein
VRLFAVSAWREAPYFDEAERAALALAESATPAHRGVGVIAMSVVRMHTYRVADADLPESLDRRAVLIAKVRADHPGLAETRLTRLEDGSYTDTWRWDSFPQLAAAFPAAGSPEATSAMALTSDATAVNGEIVDER